MQHCADFVGQAIPEGYFGARADLDREAGKWSNIFANNTYKGLRLVGEDYSLYHAVWCTNETELYDLTVRHAIHFPMNARC